MRLAMINAPGPGVVADLVAFALALPKSEAQDFWKRCRLKSASKNFCSISGANRTLADLQRKIQDEVNGKINKLQREFFLKEQLKTIKKELGFEEDGKRKSARTFRERIELAGMSEEVRKRHSKKSKI